MSDCSDDFMVEDEESDFGSESEENSHENIYYNAKAKLPSPSGLSELESLVDQKTTIYCYKASKQLFKATRDLKWYDKVLSLSTQNLGFLSRNYIEKTLQGILDRIDPNAYGVDFIQTFYDKTLKALGLMANERLMAKTNLKLAKLWLQKSEYDRLVGLCADLKKTCGEEDWKMGTLLLEVYAIEIQMYETDC